MTAKFEGTKTYAAPKERIFRACIDVMQLSGFKITASDPESGFIGAVSPDSQFSSRADSGFFEEAGLIVAELAGVLSKFRERISVRIGDEGVVHALSISEPRTIRLDQGRNRQHILGLWTALDTALGQVATKADSGLTRTAPAAAPLTSGSDATGFPGRGHAFISYVREDASQADWLQRRLEAAEIPVWRDTASLWPGEDWHVRIRDAITRDALVFIACFSSHGAARRASYQNEELVLAIDQQRLRRPGDPWLIPVRFDDCDVPDFQLGASRTLASIQRADLFGPSRDLAAGQLVETVQRLLRLPPSPLAQPSAPAPLPAVPDAAPADIVSWIVEASPRLWLRSGPGFDCPTVGWLDHGQRAYGNRAGVESGGTTWLLLRGNDDSWAWGNSAYLRLA